MLFHRITHKAPNRQAYKGERPDDGKWFDGHKAKSWSHYRPYNGWDGIVEKQTTLHLTRLGVWVRQDHLRTLEEDRQSHELADRFTVISETDAVRWFFDTFGMEKMNQWYRPLLEQIKILGKSLEI